MFKRLIILLLLATPAWADINHQRISAATDEVARSGWRAGCAQIEEILPDMVEMALNPNDTASWFPLVYMTAGCLQEIYQEERKAIAILERALELAPDNPHIAYMLGNGYFRIGDDISAEATLERLLSEDAVDDLWYKGHAGGVRATLAAAKLRIAAPHQGRARLYEAIALLQEANQIEGLQNVSPVRHGQIGHAEMALGNFDEAIRQFTIAVTLTEENEVWGEALTRVMLAENLMGLGQALFLQGNVEQGYVKMDHAIDLVADNSLLTHTLKLIRKSMSESVVIEQDPNSNIKNAIPLEEHIYKEWKQ